MNNSIHTLMLTSVFYAAMWAGSSFAADLSAGMAKDTDEASRGAPVTEFSAVRSKGPGGVRTSESARSGGITENTDGFTVLGRSRSGEVKRTAPSQKVIEAITGKKKAEGKAATQMAADPGAEDEGARAVIGADNRIRVTNTKKYPYNVVGMIESVHTKTNSSLNCTAALIGPSTIITAAQCVYVHELEGGWMDEITFWPGLNGENDVPLGGFDWTNAYVLEGFVTQYKDSYDSVWPYDVALIELAQPVGDQTGYLGWATYPDMGDFQANLVGYQSDKEDWTQWRAVCDVTSENLSDVDFVHDCDADGWSTGAPLYVYDSNDKSRRIVGLNMGGLQNANWALRISEPINQWILENSK